MLLRWLNGAETLEGLLRWPAEYAQEAREMMVAEYEASNPDAKPKTHADRLKGPGKKLSARAVPASAEAGTARTGPG